MQLGSMGTDMAHDRAGLAAAGTTAAACTNSQVLYHHMDQHKVMQCPLTGVTACAASPSSSTPGPSRREHLMRLPAQHTSSGSGPCTLATMHTESLEQGPSTMSCRDWLLLHTVMSRPAMRSAHPPWPQGLSYFATHSPALMLLTCRAGLFLEHLLSNGWYPVIRHPREVVP